MKSKLLLAEKYKWVGLVLLIPSLVLGFLVRFREFQFTWLEINIDQKEVNRLFGDDKINLTDEFALTGIILGLLFIAFAKERNEDEFISRTRLESLQWAVLINYGLLIIATWLIHGFSFIDVMMYNMLTILIIFIIRFHFILYVRNKQVND